MLGCFDGFPVLGLRTVTHAYGFPKTIGKLSSLIDIGKIENQLSALDLSNHFGIVKIGVARGIGDSKTLVACEDKKIPALNITSSCFEMSHNQTSRSAAFEHKTNTRIGILFASASVLCNPHAKVNWSTSAFVFQVGKTQTYVPNGTYCIRGVQ